MENNNRMNLAEEVRTRVMSSQEQKNQAITKAVKEAAKEFASEMNSLCVRFDQSELEEKWPNMLSWVLQELKEEGFKVECKNVCRRTGFLGWREVTVTVYEISIPTK